MSDTLFGFSHMTIAFSLVLPRFWQTEQNRNVPMPTRWIFPTPLTM